MNTLTFLNLPLLSGLALASIPILIHLLYRRQYRRVDWAPMRYLKLSMQRNRRRIRIEQILLLLLRTAIILLLFFAVARPVMHAEGLSRWLGGAGRTNRIVVLDDSLSMGYTDAGKMALGRAQEIVVDLLSTFGPKDRLTLVLVSAPKQPLLREVELDNIDDLARVVRDVQPSEVFGAWEPALQAIDELIAGGSYPLHEVTLVTDLRREGWESPPAELASNWASQRVRLRVFDVGAPQTSNLALTELAQLDRLALAGTPTRFEALVHNDTTGELAGVEANFVIDGKASLVRVPTMAAGETIKLPLVATLQEPGAHDVAFELPADAMAGDNRRSAVVDVRQSIDMLLVDGAPSSDPLGGETDFLALALSLSGEAAEAYKVEIVNDSEWASTPTAHPDLLVLANVAHLSADQAEMLEHEVNAGMGLMIFVGDQTDPDNYNQLLFRGGAGPLPAAFESVSDNEFTGLLNDALEGSPLEKLGQLSPAALERIKFRKTYEVRMPQGSPDGVHVLARWNNQAAAPAAIQKVVGAGQVLLWTVAADRTWSDWPTDASYVLAMREVARAIARAGSGQQATMAGQPLRIELPATHAISQPAIEPPGAKEPKPLTLSGAEPTAAQAEASPHDSAGKAASAESAPADRAAKSPPALNYTDTRRAGLYKMTWHDSVSGAMSETMAVNPDPRESQLERIPIEQFKDWWGALEPDVVSIGAGTDAAVALGGQEIWRTLAAGLLGLLVVEACFARWAGRPR